MSIISDKRLEGINPFSETKSNIQSMYGLAKYSLSSSRKKEIEKNYRRHIGAKPTKGDQAEKEAFISAFELLLDREIREGKLKPGDQNKVKDLDIFFGSQTAKYTNPRTGVQETIDLYDIDKTKYKDVRKAVKEYIIESGSKSWLDDHEIRSNSKGDLRGEETLKRNNETLQKLPNEHKEIQEEFLPAILPSARSEVTRSKMSERVLFVEYFLTKWKEKVQNKIEEKETIAKQNNSPILHKEINQLKGLLVKINEVDLFALSRALVLFPQGSHFSNEIDAATHFFEKQLKEEILSHKNNSWTLTNPFKLQKKPLTQEEHTYIQDAKGLFYLNRTDYYRFCEKNCIKPKKEGITELLMKEAIDFSAKGKSYEGESIIHNRALFEGFDVSLREEMTNILSSVAVPASHAIPEGKLSEYQIKAADDEASKAQNRTDLQTGVAEHRKRIDWELKPQPVPIIPKQTSGEWNIGKKVLTVAVAAAPLVAAHRFGYLPKELSDKAISMITTSAMPLTKGLFAYNLSSRTWKYIREPKRDQFGKIVVKTDMWRVTKLGLAVLAGLGVLWATGSTDAITDRVVDLGGSAVNYAYENSFSTSLAILLARALGRKIAPKRTPAPIKLLTGATADTLETVTTVSNAKKIISNIGTVTDTATNWGLWFKEKIRDFSLSFPQPAAYM